MSDKIEKIRKRNGQILAFDATKISQKISQKESGSCCFDVLL